MSTNRLIPRLRLGERGLALAYASLPLGAFKGEQALIAESISSDWMPEVFYLIGQADLALRMSVPRFDLVLESSYPSGDSEALAFNWTFAVPFDLEQKPHKKSAGGERLSFFLHLRFRRSLLAYRDAEPAAIRMLHGMLEEYGLEATVSAGLGWSDLIVDGSFPSDGIERFGEFILRTHELHLQLLGQRLPVFQRTLTIFGYRPPTAPPIVNATHVTFVRALPGSFDGVKDVLASCFEAPSYKMWLIDGKADLVVDALRVTVAEQDSAFLTKLQNLAEFVAGENDIQKLETHLVLAQTSELPRFRDEDTALTVEAKVPCHHTCDCKGRVFTLEERLKTVGFDRLPVGLRSAIQNLLFLFGTALRDPTTCCDLRPAVAACEASLTSLLKSYCDLLRPPDAPPGSSIDEQLRAAEQQIAAVDAQLAHDFRRLFADRFQHFEDWHSYSERVLAQRTVGTFEEILGQSDRVTIHRGGVQKFLYLADALINEFARRIPKNPEDASPLDISFATLYDSVDSILTVVRSRHVRIPVRNLFTLPVAVSDLWHEVGAAFFFLRYRQERLKPEPSLKIDVNALYAELADHYGDLVVFWYGFRGRFGPFADSLLRAWRDSQAGFPSAVIPLEILTRLYLVFELYLRRWTYSRHGYMVSPTEAPFAGAAVEALHQILARRYDGTGMWNLLVANPTTWNQLYVRVTSDQYDDFNRPLADDFLMQYPPSRTPHKLPNFFTGEIAELDGSCDLNDVFGEFSEMVNHPKKEPGAPWFRSMAALGKSVVQELHRRQMSLPEDRRRPTSNIGTESVLV